MDGAPPNSVPFPTDAAWSETGRDANEDHGDDSWGEGAAASGEYLGAHSGAAEQDAWGASSEHGWGSPVPAPGGWGEPVQPAAVSGWGQSSAPVSGGGGVYGSASQSRGGVQANPQPTPTAVARAPALGLTSLHPSAAAAHMSSPQGWGAAPPVASWGDPPTTWGQPAAPRQSPAAKPAWTNWAHEAKMSQPQSTQNPRQQHAPRNGQLPPPSLHPSQYPNQNPSHMNPQLVAEQHSILRSIQEQNARVNGRSHQSHLQQSHSQPAQYADSWDRWRNDGWGDRASTIPEEDEEHEHDGWEDDEDEDDGWGQGHGNQRVRFSPSVDYAGQAPTSTSHAPPHAPTHAPTNTTHYVPAPASVTSSSRHGAHRGSQVFMTPSMSSRTMRMATGTLPTPNGSMKTTVFELGPPHSGLDGNAFIDSYGEALRPAERALYNRDRPAKERFRWGFNPEKDQRVGSLLRWVAAMSNGLASIGLQRFLDTQERGALFANADFRIPSTGIELAQPAFDWLTLTELQGTLDSTLQSSVTLYDPAYQVIVFVFLLSPSGNSMAVWRRKLDVPEGLRQQHQDEISDIKAELKTNYPVYVDELPVEPEEATRSISKKKKVRFAFIRRLFGGKKKAAAAG